MTWTKRAEIKTDRKDILNYIRLQDEFHDYRIGNLEFSGKKARITVEEYFSNVPVAKSARKIWDFAFEDVSRFKITADCVVGFFVLEVVEGEEPEELIFELNNGTISVVSSKISLGIPS